MICDSIRFLAIILTFILSYHYAFSIRKIKQILAFQAIKIITEYFTIPKFSQVAIFNTNLISQLKPSFTFLAITANPITVTAMNQFHTLIQVNSSILLAKEVISS